MAGPPYDVRNPESLAPLLLTAEHASARMPVRVRDPQVRRILRSHWGWDPGVLQVGRELLRRVPATLLSGRLSRLWVDLNRRVDDPSLVRSQCEGVALPWNRDLEPDEIERRIESVHRPYHDELERQIRRRRIRGLPVLPVALHSFTPRLGGERRDFDFGVLYPDDRALARRVGEAVRRSGLRVAYNKPYSGIRGLMYSVAHHARHYDIPSLELEFNQQLFDERAAPARLADILAPILARVASGPSGC